MLIIKLMAVCILLSRFMGIILLLLKVSKFVLWVFYEDVHFLRLDDVFLDDIVGGVIIMDCFIALLFIIDEIYFPIIILGDGPF